MIPSARDTERVCTERAECTLTDSKPRCDVWGNKHTRCERVAGHVGAHYAQCGVRKPVHVRWPNGRTWALYPRKKAA